MRKEEDDEWRGGIPERLQEEAAAMVEAGASTSHRVKLEHPIASQVESHQTSLSTRNDDDYVFRDAINKKFTS